MAKSKAHESEKSFTVKQQKVISNIDPQTIIIKSISIYDVHVG